MKKIRKRRLWKVLIGVLAFIILLTTVNFIPTWNLKTKDMNVLKGDYVNVYYEKEKDAAKDVYQLADSQAPKIKNELRLTEKQYVNIYIYDHQSTMQTKKYGYIIPLLGLDWYIGDNKSTNVILTSPANPGKVHDYDNNKYAVLHEMVHAYISTINPHISLWLTEGMALYLTNGDPFYKGYLNDNKIPSSSDIRTINPIRFSNMQGYLFAPTYIEYIDKEYGWDKVLELIKTEDYEKTFGKTEETIYSEWTNFIKNYYQ